MGQDQDRTCCSCCQKSLKSGLSLSPDLANLSNFCASRLQNQSNIFSEVGLCFVFLFVFLSDFFLQYEFFFLPVCIVFALQLDCKDYNPEIFLIHTTKL